MTKTIRISLEPQFDEFIGKLIESGRYASTNDVIQAALRLLQQQENKLIALRNTVEAGENSGESELSLQDIASMVKQKYSA
ncbi:type II toxin-antitoxin system ParD family antitoxin [Rheinheimera sp. 1928-s]|uniref:type II toxin-antitoxin system ParD family antitoxin n=1 Tax=Rheinheimera sp. 1928-s TaxID=3033803 RepID=UPI0026023FC9|nr:type II toxin-antitoxin system ParD family antitoxin [Rheinheimera sp. 1928-s]MDF3124879.1 type II toxin-antitoxin system ParD family antitoxin [Rheinheimera sp. 1928-s]